MKFSEVQKECKRLGINAKGSLKELKARLAEHNGESPPAVVVTVTPPKGGFVFIGDKVHHFTNRTGHPIVSQPDNPRSITMHGYTFALNGEPVEVTKDVAAKLSNNSHFSEV